MSLQEKNNKKKLIKIQKNVPKRWVVLVDMVCRKNARETKGFEGIVFLYSKTLDKVAVVLNLSTDCILIYS